MGYLKNKPIIQFDNKELRNEIGILTDLNTTEKGSLTGAINENEKKSPDVTSDFAGAIGDGVSDDTTPIKDLIQYAKDNGKTPFINPGVYKITGTETLDLSGVSLNGMNATLDFSDFTCSTAVQSIGTRELVVDGATLEKGSNTITGVSSSLNTGDVIVITSQEQIPNTYRSTYRKGGLHYVQSYDSGTQELTVYPSFDFDITSATIEKMNPSILNISNGVTLKGLSGGSQLGLYLENCIFDLENRIESFGSGGIGIHYSVGKFTGFVRDTYINGGSTNYGVSISNCSHVHLTGAEVWGGRHSVASGGNYPSKITINGGYYAGLSNVNHAIDAHGVVKDLIVNGAIIHGGIQANADYNNVRGNTIYFHDVSGILFGSDINSKEWGTLKTGGNTIISTGTDVNPDTAGGIVCFNTVREILLGDDKIEGNWGGKTDDFHAPLWITATCKRLIINNPILTKEPNSAKPSSIYITGDTLFKIDDIILENHQLLIRPTNEGVKLDIGKVTVKGSPTHGVFINGYSTHSFEEVICQGANVEESKLVGVYIQYAKEVILKVNHTNNNGQDTSQTGINRSGVVVRYAENIIYSMNESRDTQTTNTQATGLYALDSTTLTLIGNDFRGCPTPYNTSNVSVIRRFGNVDISDYIVGSDGNNYEFDGTSWVLK